MNRESIIKARGAFQQELSQLNNIEYPSMPGQNNGMIVLYAKLLEIEKQLLALTGNKQVPAAATTVRERL